MKIVKILGFVLVGLLALALIIGAFQPTHFEFESSAEIDASKEVVFSKIDNIRSWEEWGPWKAEDPTMAVVYGETTTGLGASYSWTSENSGDGSMTITESTPPTWQKAALVFDGEEGGEGWFKLEDGENGATKTTWGMAFDMPYPINAISLFTGGAMKKQIEQMFDAGLTNLKKMCEEESAVKTYRGFTVKTMEWPGKSYLAVRKTVQFADMSAFYAESFGAIMEAVGTQKLEMDGMPCGIYYQWDEEAGTADMAAAIPVKGGKPAPSGKIQPVEVPKGQCLTIDYFGDYEGVGEAHYAMDDYFNDNGLEPSQLVLEEYITDPATQPDTSKWLTRVHYFLGSPIASEQ